MSHHWLLITFSWFGTVSLQYINTGGPAADTILENIDPSQYPLPYMNFYNNARNLYTPAIDAVDYYQPEDQAVGSQRKRRMPDDKEEVRDKRWLPSITDSDKTFYIQNDEKGTPFVIGYTGTMDENATDAALNIVEKKDFSPWGGKRDKPSIEHMWSWKRANSVREPSMPKRVRFSPWGGKRSGQMIYKPGSKSSKIIFSTSTPELTRIVSNYSPTGERFNLAGLHFVPALDKRHPIKILALSTKVDDKSLRDALPFKTFMESFPKMFKPGHPYLDVNLKTDGKRKVKFSAWGGKRSPPIIGPIWTPASQSMKESTLDTILLLRNREDKDDATKA